MLMLLHGDVEKYSSIFEHTHLAEISHVQDLVIGDNSVLAPTSKDLIVWLYVHKLWSYYC